MPEKTIETLPKWLRRPELLQAGKITGFEPCQADPDSCTLVLEGPVRVTANRHFIISESPREGDYFVLFPNAPKCMTAKKFEAEYEAAK